MNKRRPDGRLKLQFLENYGMEGEMHIYLYKKVVFRYNIMAYKKNSQKWRFDHGSDRI